MCRRDYATYNVEFVAAMKSEPSQMCNLNCYCGENRRFGSFFGWLRATQQCACNKSAQHVGGCNPLLTRSPKTERKVTVICSPKTEPKVAKKFERK